MSGRLIVVVGGQFGSEAKGHVAAQLAEYHDADLVIRTGGPNAGHTVYSPAQVAHDASTAHPFKLRQLPTASVSNPRSTLGIAAGGLIDPELLEEELNSTDANRVLIDPAATILEPKHRHAEEADPEMQWGSTKEGIGAARADRVHRTARTAGDWYKEFPNKRVALADLAQIARDTLRHGGAVLVEAAQGYGLGLHTDYYPKTTSADCRAVDALADVGLSPWSIPFVDLNVWVVVRPYPIRVAGESGPLAGETTWDDLGLPEERTTVTNKVRRVGGWDPELVYKAIQANGGGLGTNPKTVRVALTMVDQVIPNLANVGSGHELLSAELQDLSDLMDWFHRVGNCGADVGMITTSPYSAVFDMDANPMVRALTQASRLVTESRMAEPL